MPSLSPFLMLGLLAVLATATAWLGVRLLLADRRCRALLDATRRLAEGDRSARSGLPPGTGATHELAAALDEMAQALEQRQVELERTAKAQKLQALVFDTLLEGVVVTDTRGRIIDWNEGAERLFGYTREEILGKSPGVFHHPELRGALEREILAQLEREGRWTGEVPFVRKDGTQGVSEAVVVAHFDETGRRTAYIGVNRDATDRKRVEAALRHSEEQYRLLFERNPHPMWVFDPESLRFLAVNDAAVQTYGYSRDEFLGMTLKDIRPAEDIPLLLADLAGVGGSRGPDGPWRHLRKDGSTLLVDVSAHDLLVTGRTARIAMVQDVTTRVQAEEALRRSEEQLRQSQTMEAVGRLAESLAHDFNNLLTAIQGHAEMAILDAPADSPVRAELAQLQEAARSAAGLTRQLLASSRRESLQSQVLETNEVVGETVNLLQGLVSRDLRIVADLASDAWPVRADRRQLEQVVMNLALNARDAMPGGGVLVLRTSNVELAQEDPARHSYMAPGRYLLLSVRDAGVGMSREVRQRVFEPFFTTKEPGKGTGLGLFTVYGIVRQAGGHILVESEPGEGTEFRVFLPAESRAVAVHRASPELPAGAETILLVEDEAPIRLLALRLLQRIGYHVLEAASPEEALRVSSDHIGPIHLLLTDVTMPKMGGGELARRLVEARPRTPVVYMSGYSEEELPLDRSGAPPRFIHKPFTLRGLATTVREALDTAKV